MTNNIKVFMTMSCWMVKTRHVLMTEPRRRCIDLHQDQTMQFAVTSAGNLPPGGLWRQRRLRRDPAAAEIRDER
jgi:hypothetical protein